MNTPKNCKKELKEALDIALFKQPAMHAVALEKGKTTFGYYIIIAGALLGIIGQQIFPAFFRPSITFSIVMGIMQVVMTVVGIYVLSYVAKRFFKGHATHDHFFRVVSYGMIVMWLSILPQISIISSLWSLVLLFVILKAVHKLTTGGAIGTIIVGILVMWIISAVTAPIYAKFGTYGLINDTGIKNYGNSMVNPAGSGKIEYQNGKVEYGNGTMKYTDENGKTIEVQIPQTK
jgi:hypothetical protein